MSFENHRVPEKMRAYLKSDEWAEKRSERLKFDNYTCRVCGKKADQVHHLSYERCYGEERMSDLVSVCKECHLMAEAITSVTETPHALMYGKKTAAGNFMAAMREDARNIAPKVFNYLKDVYGDNLDGLLKLRENNWQILRIAVNALCRKRYMSDVAADRRSLVTDTLTDDIAAICMGEIEHQLLNMAQENIKASLIDMHDTLQGTWKELGENLGIKASTISKLKNDNGGYGPSLREEVLGHVLEDAAHGIPVQYDFKCLTGADIVLANQIARYVAGVSGEGEFRGEEYKNNDINTDI